MRREDPQRPTSADVKVILGYLAPIVSKVFKWDPRKAKEAMEKARDLLPKAEEERPELIAAVADSLRQRDGEAESRKFLALLRGSLLDEFHGLTKPIGIIPEGWDPVDPAAETAAECFDHTQLKEELKNALAMLDPSERLTVVAHGYLNWTFEEIRERLGFTSKGKVHHLYKRACKKLAGMLQDHRTEPSSLMLKK